MAINLKSLFKESIKETVDSVGNVLDNLITSKDEREAAKLETQKEINRHAEILESATVREIELLYQDKASTRQREVEFIKATGHVDWMLWFLAIAAIVIFAFMVFSVVKGTVPKENRELIFHIFGIVEGFMLSIFSYYFGSSAGSRVKDMRK